MPHMGPRSLYSGPGLFSELPTCQVTYFRRVSERQGEIQVPKIKPASSPNPWRAYRGVKGSHMSRLLHGPLGGAILCDVPCQACEGGLMKGTRF